MDGRGWVAAEALGAAGVQLGTAFLASDECGVCPAYKEAVLAATDDGTAVTRAFSGRPARGTGEPLPERREELRDETILPYPLQNALTRPMRTAAARAGRAELLSLWAGQAARLVAAWARGGDRPLAGGGRSAGPGLVAGLRTTAS